MDVLSALRCCGAREGSETCAQGRAHKNRASRKVWSLTYRVCPCLALVAFAPRAHRVMHKRRVLDRLLLAHLMILLRGGAAYLT